jgi:hypothetical protein
MMMGSRCDVKVTIIGGFDVLTVVLTKILVWDITPVNWLHSYHVSDRNSASSFRVKQ